LHAGRNADRFDGSTSGPPVSQEIEERASTVFSIAARIPGMSLFAKPQNSNAGSPNPAMAAIRSLKGSVVNNASAHPDNAIISSAFRRGSTHSTESTISIAFRTISSVSLRPSEAPTFARRCSTFRVPAITEVTAFWCNTKRNAKSDSDFG